MASGLDPRVFHSITVEMCTGFLTLAAVSVMAKLLSDRYIRAFGGKVPLFDRIALVASGLADPTAYFAAFAGVVATFASMVTGSLAWPAERLLNSELAHNKILLTITSQSIFIYMVYVRGKYKFEIWMDKLSTICYSALAIAGWLIIVTQNSIAGHMAGKGSLADAFFDAIGVNSFHMWLFPLGVSLTIIVAFPMATAIFLLYHRSLVRRPVPAPAS